MALVRTQGITSRWATDEKLTWEARGLLAYLFAKPDDWEIRVDDLIRSGPCKEEKLRRVLKELEEHGYAHREKKRQYDGTFQWVTKVQARPAADSDSEGGRAGP